MQIDLVGDYFFLCGGLPGFYFYSVAVYDCDGGEGEVQLVFFFDH